MSGCTLSYLFFVSQPWVLNEKQTLLPSDIMKQLCVPVWR